MNKPPREPIEFPGSARKRALRDLSKLAQQAHSEDPTVIPEHFRDTTLPDDEVTIRGKIAAINNGPRHIGRLEDVQANLEMSLEAAFQIDATRITQATSVAELTLAIKHIKTENRFNAELVGLLDHVLETINQLD